MDQAKNFKYYVGEFRNSPCKNFDKFVSIPDTWITLCDIQEQLAEIKYPVEDMSITKKRVMKRENYSKDWQIFVAKIIYGTDWYEDANVYIQVLNNKFINERSYAKTTNIDYQLSTSMNIDPEASGAIINHDAQSALPIDTLSNQPSLADSNLETRKPSIEVSDTDNDVNEGRSKRYITRQAIRLPRSTRYKNVSLTRANSLERNKRKDYIEETANSEKSDENEFITKTIEGLSNLEPIFGADFLEMLSELYSHLGVLTEASKRRYLEYVKQYELVHDMIKSVEHFNNLFCKASASVNHSRNSATVSEEMTARARESEVNVIENVTNTVQDKEAQEEVVKRKKAKKRIKKGKRDDDDDKYPTLKLRGNPRKFILPPDYDKNDSRWTLRYREKADGLDELMPHSNVYVNTIRLSNCKRISKDSKTLARMLLTEVFTTSALSTCSLTGKKANAFSNDYTDVRPGLDEYARNVLLTFVEQYAQENNWVKLDGQSILNSLRNKLHEMRSRYG